jgi:glycosyltransferase involved in cell wall biosynthesis
MAATQISNRRIAVVIPVKDRAALIGRAIASVLAQTRPVDEVIVVDDGSSDNTCEIVASLVKEDSRIQLIRNTAGHGASAARNQGILLANSDWIGFLDSDDCWYPRKMEVQMEAVNDRDDVVACFTGWQENVGSFSPPTTITLDQLRGRNLAGPTSTALVRRSALLDVVGFDSSLPSCQDWDLWLRLRLLGDFSVIPEPMILLDKNPKIRISTNRTAVLSGHATVFSRALSELDNSRLRRRVSASHSIRMMELYMWEFNDPYNAFLSGLKSLIQFPTRQGIQLLRSAARSSLRRLVTR